MRRLLAGAAIWITYGFAQTTSVPNTWPHAYPGIPQEAFSPEWQSYFEVKDSLPNITAALPRSFAGSIPVNRPNHPNDTLFFWGFEKKNGSLTVAANTSQDPWLIWLQGGPGSSSMIAFMTENGPLHITPNYSIVHNALSWNNLVDSIWVDQPVGTGYSTSDRTGYIANEDEMAQDFLGFLSNLVKVFPSLATRPLYLTGESYAGTYIPYITKALFSTPNPPVKLRKISIGDGSLGSLSVLEELPALTVIETYPQLIGYDEEVFRYFQEQSHLCGFDFNLSYPENGHFPTLPIQLPTDPSSYLLSDSRSGSEGFNSRFRKTNFKRTVDKKYSERSVDNSYSSWWRRGKLLSKRRSVSKKRDLSGRANGTIDPFYGCYLFDEMTDYAVNFSFPWTNGNFDVYDIPDGLNPEAPLDSSVFLNDNRTRAALHAPTSKNWIRNFNYPFGSVYNRSIGNQYGDPSVEPMAFLSELASNATANNVSILFYSGNDDSLVTHRGTEVIIQNMTFGGIQGFTRKPSTPWFDDSGNFAGIVHQERNLTYVLFKGAGHQVPEFQPASALVFLREFVLGSNETGLVISNSTGEVSIVGGENSTLANDVFPGGAVFYFGSGTTAGTTTIPAETQAAWAAFIATATATATSAAVIVTSEAVPTSPSSELTSTVVSSSSPTIPPAQSSQSGIASSSGILSLSRPVSSTIFALSLVLTIQLM